MFTRLFLVTALIALVAALTSGAAHAEEPVSVQIDEGGVPAVIVRPAAGAKVSVPACRGVVWQRFDPDAAVYEPISTRACKASEPATTLTEEGKRYSVDAKVKPDDVVRAVVVVGEGCTPGRPFSIADCKRVQAIEGPQLTVRAGD